MEARNFEIRDDKDIDVLWKPGPDRQGRVQVGFGSKKTKNRSK